MHSWQNKSMNHVEGGWPAEVKTQAGEIKNYLIDKYLLTARYCIDISGAAKILSIIAFDFYDFV